MAEPHANAFAAFYALSPAGRSAAAVRLVALLKRARRRAVRRYFHALELDFLHWAHDGNTEDHESHLQTLTGRILWLEVRYNLRPSARLLAHLRDEEQEQITPHTRDTSRTRRQKIAAEVK